MAKKSHILVAEDNPADIYLIQEALREHGVDCDVLVLKDGAEALRYVSQFDKDPSTFCPELFILDLHLPKHDGEEILALLRTSERCGKVPVIVMSSSDAPSHQNIAGRHESVQFFRKPRDLSQFMEIGTIVRTFFPQ
jgi:chemotaxis family two-component system response regulator Rcp1